MRPQSLAEMNRFNRAFWDARNAKFYELLERADLLAYIKRRFVKKLAGKQRSPARAWRRFRAEPSFEARIINFHRERESGAFERYRASARCPRYQAAGNRLSRRDLVKALALRAENARQRTQALWEPFYAYLQALGLNPVSEKHPTNLDNYRYSYDGKNGRLSITHRQFEKLVPELAPRREARS